MRGGSSGCSELRRAQELWPLKLASFAAALARGFSSGETCLGDAWPKCRSPKVDVPRSRVGLRNQSKKLWGRGWRIGRFATFGQKKTKLGPPALPAARQDRALRVRSAAAPDLRMERCLSRREISNTSVLLPRVMYGL